VSGYSLAGNTEILPEPKTIVIQNVKWQLTGENGSPTSWNFAIWDTSNTTKKIRSLHLSYKGLTGERCF